MIKILRQWADRYLSDPEAMMLLVFILGGFVTIFYFGKILLPVFVAIAITILLQWWVNFLVRLRCPHAVAYWLVYLLFITFLFGSLVLIIPLLWKQSLTLLSDLPTFFVNSKAKIMGFISEQQSFLSEQYFEMIFNNFVQDTQTLGKQSVSMTISAIPGLITWVVYLILVPLMVFFFLRDHAKIVDWLKDLLPEQHGMVRKVWKEMIQQINNYIQGKLVEIVICGGCTYLAFLYFGLNYALLLGILVGLSVVIPYIGAVVVTVPVFIVAYLQWGLTGGLTGDLAMLMYTYLIIQFLDGNILVPLLFSEAVNLHPVAIIIAILFFGAVWGFWGVFFAIPLATLIKTVINAWPRINGAEA